MGIRPRARSIRMSRRLALSSLPLELVTVVAEKLDTRSLAHFAAASAACLAAAQHELRVALRAAVERCLLPGRSCKGMGALVKARAFRLPDDLVAIPSGAFMHCTLTQVILPATVAHIGNGCFWGCSSLRKLTLSTDLATIGDQAFNNCYSLTEFALPAAGFSREPTCSHSAFHGCAPSLSQRSTGRRVRLVCASCKNPCEVFTSGLKEFPTRVQCPNCKMSEHEMYLTGIGTYALTRPIR